MPRIIGITRLAACLGLLAALACATVAGAGAAPAARFELAIGGVGDACSGAHLGGAALTFTPEVAPGFPPGPPVRVTTNPGGQFNIKLLPGDYRVAVALDGYSQAPNTDGDQTGVFSVRTGIVNHLAFALHPPSPC